MLRRTIHLCYNHLSLARKKKEQDNCSVVQSVLQIKLKFVLHLEIKVPDWKVERHIIHNAFSPVCSFNSQLLLGEPFHLLELVHWVFWSWQSMLPSTRKCWMFTSAHKLHWEADVFSHQDSGPDHFAIGAIISWSYWGYIDQQTGLT